MVESGGMRGEGSGGGPAAAVNREAMVRVGAGEVKRRGWIFRTNFRVRANRYF